MFIDRLYNFFPETSLITTGTERDAIVNVLQYSCKVPVILVRFFFKLSGQIFLKNSEISYFMKIRPMRAELFHADGETDRQTDRQS